MSPVLQTTDLEKRFGGLIATRALSLRVERGARHALIGPNGAGKTTVINLLSGVLTPSNGRIVFDGEDITARRAHQRVRLGIARSFQINQLFAELTPIETLGLAVTERLGVGAQFWSRLGKKAVATEIAELVERFHLTDVIDTRTATLPYGKQRLLELALAIACRPRLLLLDEPAAGVPDSERAELLAAIKALPADVTVLLIEHDMDLVFGFADRISVLVNGALFVEGTPEEVARDPRVKAVYLGEAFDA
jgi:ABC-type branched-subunit amino acid transport system ATPase component